MISNLIAIDLHYTMIATEQLDVNSAFLVPTQY